MKRMKMIMLLGAMFLFSCIYAQNRVVLIEEFSATN
jgi:hypothetical protein